MEEGKDLDLGDIKKKRNKELNTHPQQATTKFQ